MPLSPDTDRELVDLLSTLTDEGKVVPLRETVGDFGPERVARIIRDGFAVVFQVPDGASWETVIEHMWDWPSLPCEEATELVHLEPVPLQYRIRHAVGALALEGAPNLVFDYAADVPDAVAEVRARHGLA